jgi:hypothetical protein
MVVSGKGATAPGKMQSAPPGAGRQALALSGIILLRGSGIEEERKATLRLASWLTGKNGVDSYFDYPGRQKVNRQHFSHFPIFPEALAAK